MFNAVAEIECIDSVYLYAHIVVLNAEKQAGWFLLYLIPFALCSKGSEIFNCSWHFKEAMSNMISNIILN